MLQYVFSIHYCYVLSSASGDTVIQSEEGASQKNKMKIQHLYWFHVQAAWFIWGKLHLFHFHFYTYTNLFISAKCHIFFSEIFFFVYQISQVEPHLLRDCVECLRVLVPFMLDKTC